ncbi:MAG TPA: SRPBCC family protein [Streptosporangiaceae bacterium]|nr:SRPBCC family protein [Streptosporangiaceae bacterium]
MAMELDNSFTVPVPPDQAWDVLLDVKRIAPCMPGATVDEVDGDVITGRIKVRVGPVSLTYRGTAKFTERDPEAHMVLMEASGKETRGAGTASATVRASLAPDASGIGTQVTMHTTMNVTGRPAQFGRGVMVEVGGKLVDQFATNLSHLIAGDTGTAQSGPDGAGAAASPGAVADSAVSASASAASPGAVAASAVSASASADSAVPEAPGAPGASGGSAEGSGPAAATAAEPGGGTGAGAPVYAVGTTAPPPQTHEDSLNLIKLVGPSLLKRVVPVVVGAAGLALLSRLFWRLRQRRAGKA